MFGRPSTWFLLLLMALLASLTWWADTAVQAPVPKQDSSLRHDPDYILNNFHTLKTDIDGRPKYRLAAVEMQHFPDDDSTHLVRPHFTQYALSGEPYTQIESQRGTVTSNGEQVYLTEQVRILRAATPDQGPLVVTTEYLHITPDDEIARTDKPVTITQDKSVARAGGMIYDKKNSILTLLRGKSREERVRIHYEKPPHAQAAKPAKKAAVKKTPAKAATTKKAAPGTTKPRRP
ncbi:MAG: LPS export ABC transporter periplasmic protein LptC [Methylobacillus sp.]|jgi:lipopolysaccharide export system protein LptC|nr:LPS export ABC transporter periplasmic protein LptC [Methylobacillus sp.]